MKMKAGCSQLKPVVFILIFNLCFYASYQLTELQVCKRCNGTVLNDTKVGQFCFLSDGRVDGRCCFRNDNTTNPEHIIGLDLSNCSLSHVEDLQGASTVLIIDLSLNPIVNISDTAFQGFTELNYIILPEAIVCPGGNVSWDKVEISKGTRLCEGQKNMCNQTGHLSTNCPLNSLCAPYGPGFFECSCAENYYGYKCLRQGGQQHCKVFSPNNLWIAPV
ncbi:all-trans retinoic acid-induced differentiation factor isoform X2 [Mastacembelus armatus]|uniref:all-trans retinoic acid-induced differentiation factor isoform X2 n=1 Tax=Mastacembelus armatus TaxID=205130 RepID=UPI000E458C9D|nr:all-trans retinoic acid-induced differentiation factor isoform X2 [Mastacembelus armatus]